MIRILTWNILAPGWFNAFQDVTYGLNIAKKENFNKYYNFHNMRVENVIQSIKKIDPDVICLQEVTPNSMKLLEKGLGYKSADTFIMNRNIANEGVATLYNPKRVTIERIIKFIDSENEPNVYTYVRKDDKRYLVLNVHLPRGGKTYTSLHYSLNYDDDQLQKDIRDRGFPFIICGDFNSSNRMTPEIEKKYHQHYWAKSTTNDYDKYVKMLKNYRMYDASEYDEKFYTTRKTDGVTDHEDHIFARSGTKYRVYYGDYVKKFNPKRTDQGERGLIHFDNNMKRPDWETILNQITSDHRWMCIDII